MIEFKNVPIPDGAVLSSTMKTFQERTAEAFRQVPDPFSVQVTEVNGGRYTVTENDQEILVDSRGGPVTIILQRPINKQRITVIRKYSKANPVTIVTIDGTETGNAGTAIAVTFDVSVTLVASGSQWWMKK